MNRVLQLVCIVAMSLVASGALLAQDNPFVGTWKLNVANSKYVGTPAPRSETRVVVMQGDVEKVTFEGIAADGSPISYGVMTKFDGKDEPYSGKQPFGADTVAAKHVDANTNTSVAKKAGKTLLTTTWQGSKDGKVTTQTTMGTNAQGQPISITAVWDKQ
jgi:hypothetical protein